jgi:hypothetical protein
MKIKTSKIPALELVINEDGTNYRLAGTKALAACNAELARSIECGTTNKCHSFRRMFGENSFFYVLELISNDKVIQHERGVGNVKKIDDQYYLERAIPICYGPNSSQVSACHNGPSSFLPQSNEYIIAYSTFPHSHQEALILPHSVLTSHDSCCANMVSLQENSFLARVKDDIVSLDTNSDEFINYIKEAISSYKNQLSLKSSKLSVKNLSTNNLQLNPSDSPQLKEGNVYYDATNKVLKFYDGSNWKVLLNENA